MGFESPRVHHMKTNQFLAQIPANAYRFNERDPLTTSFHWQEMVEVDGVTFESEVTAHENMWSGFGNMQDPARRLGNQFYIRCIEEGDRELSCKSELKDRRMRNVTRRKGLSHFDMRSLSGEASTIQEARDKMIERCKWFLYSKRT